MTREGYTNRFYKQATSRILAGGHGVYLDNHALKTPAKATTVLPTAQLAHAIAAEWNAQGKTLCPDSMPLTRLAVTAIDQTAPKRPAIADTLVGYGQTDTLCYLADHPEALRCHQQTAWKPWRDWAEKTIGIRLAPVTGLIAGTQPVASLETIRMRALALDDFRLTGLATACALFGSIILAFALERRALSGREAFRLSTIDEDWQSRHWGTDKQAQADRVRREQDAAILEQWYAAL